MPVKLEADRAEGMPPYSSTTCSSWQVVHMRLIQTLRKLINGFLGKVESNQQFFLPPLYLRDGDRITFLA